MHFELHFMSCRHLMERTKDANERDAAEMEQEFNINYEFADLSTIHEAYQFLIKKYVEDVDQLKNENFLDMEELKKKHQKRKKSKKNEGEGGEEKKDKHAAKEKDLKGRRSR